MMLLVVIGQVLAVVLAMLLVASGVIVGRERLARTRREYRDRLESVAPYLGLLAVVLVANKVARDVGPGISWLIGLNVTPYIHRLDGLLLWPVYPESTPQVVVWLQSNGSPELTAYFSFVYVFGYVFLLVFPLLSYFALPDPTPLRRTVVAYGANYLIGVLCYVVFIAYGPRNLIASDVEGLLFTQYTQFQFLTASVNHQTNVFPSLHTSMAVTAALLAWTTREEYPLWLPVAAVLAVSVALSTMYLGIHWATDVVFGVALAWVSVRIGRRLEDTPLDLGAVRQGARGALGRLPSR
ncbi:phosphoesterase PA-phosphatase [Halobacteriales archaeon QH_10_70_21]|nr:MAG: phosphoesterase PA-phosphatase [Halobacteriales archaeon QH_10_70_21]